ncbi:(d)CMP kinase [Lacibacterium aquatile]|uniref:Cytidylate kinase n=1 Tax=Lacibacterium aquatile TaxID=1168082 RepID=A0ABW5DM18_9PROT
MRVIAVDGPAASGKGTLARRLAQHFGLAHLDTGLLYRAVGWQVRDDIGNSAAAVQAARAFDIDWLRIPELRGEAAGQAASKISAIPQVREALLEFQRSFCRQPLGAVLDGRDIGTVICPEAPAKLFVTASVEVRAGRRHRELQAREIPSIYAEVLQDLIERDARDSQRTAAPMKAADDALLLDTSGLDADQAFDAALSYISPRIS